MARRSGSSEKKELLKDLKGGIASLRLVGAAKVNEHSFGGVQQKDGKTWKHVDSSFGVEIEEGNVIYGQVKGGYVTTRPLIYAMDEDYKPLQIPFDERFDEEWLGQVNNNNKFSAMIEREEIEKEVDGETVKVKEGKLIRKEFLSPIDFEEYLAKNLPNKAEVIVFCDVEYSEWQEKQYRNHIVRNVILNEERTVNGVVTPPKPHEATLRQTFLVNEYALEKSWAKDVKAEGSAMVNAFVPQYVGKLPVDGEYVEVKKVLAFPQRFKLEVPEDLDDEMLTKRLKLFKGLFSVKAGTLREISLVMKLNEGYQEATGEAEITEEMQELIDCGIMTEEEVKEDLTIRGNKVSEVIFVKPGFKKDEGGTKKILAKEDDKYDPSALSRPVIEKDEDLLDDEGEVDLEEEFDKEDEPEVKKEDKKDEKVEDDDDGLDDLFDDEDIFG